MAQQRAASEQTVMQRADEWAAAERSCDAEALDRILAPEFVGVGPLGFMLSKEQWLARYRSGDLKTTSLDWDGVTARVFGDAAILIGRETLRAAYQGHDTGGQFRTTLVFVQQNGAWLLAGLQHSAIAEPPNLGSRS